MPSRRGNPQSTGQTASKNSTVAAMDKLGAMHSFVKVVALGSYAEAGRALGLTRSAVSKGVMELEQLLGARLLDRTTRSVSPTEAGLAYYERCLDIIARVEETELQVSRLHDEPRGTLKINAPVSFGVLYLGPAIAEFMQAYSDLKIELILNDRFIDPIEEGADVTIRIAELEDSSLIARKIAPARRVVVGSPAYFKSAGKPMHPADLLNHRCLNYGHTTNLQKWRFGEGKETSSYSINALCARTTGMSCERRRSRTWSCKTSELHRWAGHSCGRLQVVLQEFVPTELGIYALYTPNRYLAAKTRVLIDFLADRFAHTPPWDNFDQDRGKSRSRRR